jgi:cell division protease FtsH
MVERKKKSPKKSKGSKEPKIFKINGRTFLLYFAIFLAVASLFSPMLNDSKVYTKIPFSALLTHIEKGDVLEIKVNTINDSVLGKLKDGTMIKSTIMDYPDFIPSLKDTGVQIDVESKEGNLLVDVFIQFLPFLLILGIWFFIFRQAQGANNQAISFGKTRAKKRTKEEMSKIKFKDIGGIAEAVEELKEIVDFLKNPKKYQKLGARIPKGVMLVGPPGTGKTLLAKGIAGEADVSFFSLSGSEFVEMFVGVGASRVRDLFAQAKKVQPSIIFIDELDAVGRHRGAGLGGGHDEREQTLNQLLIELDGFDETNSVIIIAATNRPDILDKALLRPGRFDRQIVIDVPDVKGREEILSIHKKGKILAKNIDIKVLARRTPGFTGADLANLMNEAALLAARRNKKSVTMKELEEAIDRVMAGPEKKSKVVDQKEKEIIAYHETGHAVVTKMLKETDPVHKISILPRGMALGYTLQLPEKDKYLVSKEELLNQITILMGGRVAEEIKFKQVTTGASNDIKRATEIAQKIVCEYGMSSLGNRTYGKRSEEVFLGRDIQDHSKDYGEEIANKIDLEINKIIEEGYKKAKEIITANKANVTKIIQYLLEQEVMDADEFNKIFESKTSKKPVKKTEVKK